ncbi:hypothetical protein L596_011964 [Steinernema carpocapsae]|uniref:Uncharacterized protein n=1 Tax=Steinernema carpocapsae TaxID=34508 RepID=A0A4U5NWG5_STECR|nr:hypothetical protein L596_011964 [Steinernema carpocapsae]
MSKPKMPQEASPSLLSPLFERSSLEPTITAARQLRRKNHIEKLPKDTTLHAIIRDAHVWFVSGTQMSGTQMSGTQLSGHRLKNVDSESTKPARVSDRQPLGHAALRIISKK